ncbi:hypothetical protein P153DRAFT_329534 [Dothidotthia symphoricarpi CBS 119687]|uniref:Rhodopsin domain-containing protein n=1 Tax=Dothidotthia symphoricarpi CBS 119687 TaxID=1392245 RepID=A0A6A6ATA7_9PLEO|nr:uncharacterized protein P153DRAFT_329534 [Dothidotthia symphoricarpi CBS 119687]KAF2134806.1 hypothetical protein P153DRAFT_329534 [Dothidotthia symphoricarpi CBS 119687]
MDTVYMRESRQIEVIVIAWVMTGAAIFAVAVKLFTRVRIVRVVGWDDVFIVFSLILSIAASSFAHYSAHLGFGRPMAAVQTEFGQDRLVVTARWQMIGYRAFSFPNISIVILVCQLLDPKPLRTRLLYGMTILQILFAMITVVITFVQCTPTQKLWDKTLPGTCWDPSILNNFSYWLCAYTTLTDFVLAIVPVVTFWKLQMKQSTKFGLCVMMSLTMLSAIVTIVKGTYLHLFTDAPDILYDPVPLVLWGLVEQNAVIMAACVSTMRPFFHKSWIHGTSSRQSRPASANQLTILSLRRSHAGHRQVDSISNIPLDEMENRDYAESSSSQQSICHTLRVSMERQEDPSSKIGCASKSVPLVMMDAKTR